MPLTDLCREAPPGHVFGAHSLLDAVDLLLVAAAVPHGVLLGFLQGVLQGFDSLHCHSQTPLQLRQLAAEVGVVPNQLSTVGGGRGECHRELNYSYLSTV